MRFLISYEMFEKNVSIEEKNCFSWRSGLNNVLKLVDKFVHYQSEKENTSGIIIKFEKVRGWTIKNTNGTDNLFEAFEQTSKIEFSFVEKIERVTEVMVNNRRLKVSMTAFNYDLGLEEVIAKKHRKQTLDSYGTTKVSDFDKVLYVKRK